ncbi:hypothetical protein SPRG_06633 [Saprolegnia parasitica CBS 223.65]|uniref:Uncharacterized protein n=1 Tax=Saprolegnia parasitica (strain CBS 223.65) TaxID=695850 RepID=A0A067CGS8_SAPPC|nr:hypothetical protein SPRG_06633 [Saprolegnia parasitica CBS 223.65]KDO28395.1 hypothetical protein SPRG_06633 [Saprolegnia parasitica CBS 223.65]|eukprot:XP_012200837.1 hypothetical protein SPRG_06633 [Saprolegnia parasitica CBS 223.65]
MNPAIPAYEAAVDLLRRSMAIEDRAAADFMQQQQYAGDLDGSAAERRPTRDDVVAALLSIADDPPLALQRIAAPIPCMRDNLSFDRLERVDAALVDVLVATGRFDVALVSFKVDQQGGYTNFLSMVEPHPACGIPTNVASRLPDKRVHAYLGDVSRATPSCAIVFWPTPFRASIVGLDATLPLAQTAIDNVPGDRLGLSVRDLLLGVLSAVVLVQPQPTQLTAITRVFVQCNDVALDLRGVGICIHALLKSYGWIPLFSALQGLFERSKGAIDSLCRLLASLAGLTSGDDALCPPLEQPFVCELVKLLSGVLLGYLKDQNTRSNMHYWILLDWYIDKVAPHMPHGNWISLRLPPALVVVVDSYLFRPPFGDVLASSGLTLTDKLRSLSMGLVDAIARQPTLHRPKYLAAISTKINEVVTVLPSFRRIRGTLALNGWWHAAWRDRPTTISLQTAYVRDVLDAMHTLGHCDEALFTAMRHFSGRKVFIAGLLRFLQHPATAVASRVQSLVASYVFSIAPSFTVTDAFGRMRESKALAPSVKSVVDALHVLTLVAPHEVRTFGLAWAAALPETLDATRHALYSVVVEATKRLPHDTGLISDLAAQCLANFHKDRAPVPDVSNVVIDDIAVDVDHCAQCAAFVVFLRDGTRIEFEFAGLCEALLDEIASHQGQLGLHHDDVELIFPMTDDLFRVDVRGGNNSMGEAMRGPYVVRKRTTQVGRKMGLEHHIERLSHLHRDTKAVAKLQLLLQPVRAIEAADMNDAQPPLKRPRLDA